MHFEVIVCVLNQHSLDRKELHSRLTHWFLEFVFQEIGYTHMKVAEGVNSLLQMAGLLARLCQKTMAPVAS